MATVPSTNVSPSPPEPPEPPELLDFVVGAWDGVGARDGVEDAGTLEAGELA
jgi:hypothetical protein